MINRKPVYILISLFIASFAIITLLAFLSKKAIEKKNGFNRRLLSLPLITQKQITFPINISWFIGMQNGKLYYQGKSPYEHISTDLNLDSLSTIKLPIPPTSKLTSGVRMFLNGRYVYVADRHIPSIIAYDLESGCMINNKLSNHFTKEANITTDQFILRIKDLASQSHKFVKLDLKTKNAMPEDHFSDRKVI